MRSGRSHPWSSPESKEAQKHGFPLADKISSLQPLILAALHCAAENAEVFSVFLNRRVRPDGGDLPACMHPT
jgi:hypothetical protein